MQALIGDTGGGGKMAYWSFVWFNAQVEWIHMSCRPNDCDDSFYCLVQGGIRLLDAQVLPQ